MMMMLSICALVGIASRCLGSKQTTDRVMFWEN